MPTPTRIYLVTLAGTPHLVRAPSQAAALSHVARSQAAVAVASQDDLVHGLGVLGLKVQTAGADAPDAPDPHGPEGGTPDDKTIPIF